MSLDLRGGDNMDKETIKNLVAGLGISALMAAAAVVVTPQAAHSA